MGRISQLTLLAALGLSAWACGAAGKPDDKAETKESQPAETKIGKEIAAGEPVKLDVTPIETPEAEPEGVPEAKDPLHPIVKMTTSLGEIYLELDAEKAPISTMNFIQYAKDGFYKGTIFHRVIPTFMIQGGGMTPDMEEKKEGLRDPIKNEWDNGLKNVRGTISMARTSEPDSATAQFFINVVDNAMLDQPDPRTGAAYAVFGRVVKGMPVVDKIKDTKLIQHPKYPAPDPVTPETPVVIENVELISQFDQAALEAGMAEKQAQAQAQAKAAVEEAAKKLEAELGKPLATTASGLRYVHVTEGQGASPTENDVILADFSVSLADGKVLNSTREQGGGKPTLLPISRLLPGWKEAMLLMKPGGHIKALIPSDLAFGEKGAPNRGVPAFAPLILDLELKEIKSVESDMKAAIEKVEKETGKKVERTASGLGYVIMTEGTGPNPAPSDTVKVNYTGWLVDGTKFDSSIDRGEPTTFPLNQVIAGWTEGVGLMKVGEKRKLVIPPNLGYGDQAVGGVIPPNSVLIFEVDLLEIVK